MGSLSLGPSLSLSLSLEFGYDFVKSGIEAQEANGPLMQDKRKANLNRRAVKTCDIGKATKEFDLSMSLMVGIHPPGLARLPENDMALMELAACYYE